MGKPLLTLSQKDFNAALEVACLGGLVPFGCGEDHPLREELPVAVLEDGERIEVSAERLDEIEKMSALMHGAGQAFGNLMIPVLVNIREAVSDDASLANAAASLFATAFRAGWIAREAE